MAQETTKKAYLWGAVILIGIGTLYAIWAIFFNKGTISFTAKTPFQIQFQETTQSCDASPCDIVLAPGNYTFTLTKEGYKPYLLPTNVPILGTNQQTIEFTLIPILTELGLESELALFTEQPKNYTTYIERNKENGRQTLYYQSTQPDSAPQIATSFTRDLKDPLISPAIDEHNKIAVTDVTESESTIYLVDLEQKTRNAIISIPLVSGIKWLDSNNIIIEGRADQSNSIGIHLFNIPEQTLTPIPLETGLQNIEPTNRNSIIAATNQPFASTALDPEGELVTLSPSTEESNLIFIDYSIESNTARLLKTTDKPTSSNQIQLSLDQHSIICLGPSPLGDKVYELVFNK